MESLAEMVRLSNPTTNIEDLYDNSIDLDAIPLSALRQKCRNLLSMYLDANKFLPSPDGLSRDWRGIFHLSRLPTHYCQFISSKLNPTGELLKIWQTDSENSGSLGELQRCLAMIDRCDALDDTKELFVEDAKDYLLNKAKRERIIAASTNNTEQNERKVVKFNAEQNIITTDDLHLVQEGLPLQQYDAFVLFADEDIDFATEMIEKLEYFGLKLCVKERDLLSGLSFEHDAIRRLLTDRCNRLIVVLSPAFVLSPLNEFIANLAQSLGIVQRKRKIIPCLYEPCDLPEIFQHIHLLNYQRSKKFFNFWEKLRLSVQLTPEEVAPIQTITITEVDSTTPRILLTQDVAKPNYLAIEAAPEPLNPLLLPNGQLNIDNVTMPPPSHLHKEKSIQLWPPQIKLRTTSMVNLRNIDDDEHLQNDQYETNNNSNNNTANTNTIGSQCKVKKHKWYKKLMPPTKVNKLSSSEIDLSTVAATQNKEKKKLWFRKKMASHS